MSILITPSVAFRYLHKVLLHSKYYKESNNHRESICYEVHRLDLVHRLSNMQ